MKKLQILMISLTALLLLCGCRKIETEYRYEDLGLSVKWAKVNVGAIAYNDYGDHFAWGEIAAKDSYTDTNYKWFDDKGRITKYCSDESCGRTDFRLELEAEDDAATVLWGSGWRIPTLEEFLELVRNCTWIWSSANGVHGYKVVSNVPGYEGRYIFLPAAGICSRKGEGVGDVGCYWTSDNCGEADSALSECVVFDMTKVSTVASGGLKREIGVSVRPVCK